MNRPYSDRYLEIVMDNIGGMLEASASIGMDINSIWSLFIASPIAMGIEIGNPKYILGMSGVEYLLLLLENEEVDKLRNIEIEENSEYLWVGYAMASLQYEANLSFKELNSYIPIDYVLRLYNPFHEADLHKFIDLALERINKLG